MDKFPDKKYRHKMRDYWRAVMSSSRVKMQLGAQHLARMFPWARGEYWRGRKEKKK